MGYAEEFMCVKQFPDLYEACMAAGEAFEESRQDDVLKNIHKAFDEMKNILEERSGIKAHILLGEEGTFLSDLSKRNYEMYSSTEPIEEEDPWEALKEAETKSKAVGSEYANNAFCALQEEVSKFAKYYVRGARPNTIEEAKSTVTDGFHLSRKDRNKTDDAFGIIASGGMLLTGIILLIISAVGGRSQLMMIGLVFIVFAAVLVGLRFVKKN
ncbi:MAG: hypothetical protein IKI15_09085 [Lachnospiraceae bacterium]|nr:hypothetical protein [Lachnospiraceae bacterium]